jgi:hypothetical protein
MTMTALNAVKKTGGLLKVRDAASQLGISTKAIYRLVDERCLSAIDVSGGKNPSHRRSLRIPAAELVRFLGVHATGKQHADND